MQQHETYNERNFKKPKSSMHMITIVLEIRTNRKLNKLFIKLLNLTQHCSTQKYSSIPHDKGTVDDDVSAMSNMII